MREDLNELNGKKMSGYNPSREEYHKSYEDLYEEVKAENKILKDALEQCLYHTAMRDPDINTHRQACDSVESISKEALEKIKCTHKW